MKFLYLSVPSLIAAMLTAGASNPININDQVATSQQDRIMCGGVEMREVDCPDQLKHVA